MTSIRELAETLFNLQRQVDAQNAPQLANSSVEDGSIDHYDETGQLVGSVGKQYDGTHAAVTFGGPTPPAPIGVDAVAGAGTVTASWAGRFVEDLVAPMDFSHVEVHRGTTEDFEVDGFPTSATRVGTITSAGGGTFTWTEEAGDVWVTMITRSTAGKDSEAIERVQVTVLPFVDHEVFDQLADDLTASEGRLAEAETRITTAQEAADAAAEEARNGEIDGARVIDGTLVADRVIIPGSIGGTLIGDGVITSPKINAQDIAGAVGAFIRLDVSQLYVTETAHLNEGVAKRFFVDIFTVNKVTANHIDAESIAGAVGEFTKVKAENVQAGFINSTLGMGTTGAIIAGDWSKVFARMDKDGFSTVFVDEEGQQFVGTALGTSGENSLAIADATGELSATITPDGVASLYDLDVDQDPTFMGRSLFGKRVDPEADDGILDDAGRGVIARGDLKENVNGSTKLPTGYTPVAVIGLTMHPGRTYHVTMPFRYSITDVPSGKTGRAGIALFYTYKNAEVGDADEPATNSTFVGDFLDSYPTSVAGISNRVDFLWPSPFNTPHNIKLLVCMWSGDCQVTMSNYNPFDWRLHVVDVGPNVKDTARLLDLPSSGTTTGGGSTTTAPPAKRTYTATWDGTESQMYSGSGAKTSWSGSSKGLIQHGATSGSNMRGAVCFNGTSTDGEKKSMSAALTGATLTKAEVYLKFPHWWNSNGGTAVVRPLNGTTLPDTLASPSSSTVSKRYTARGQGYWITIPTSWISPTKRGVVVGPALDSTAANYGYWCAPGYATAADRVKIRLTYTR